VIVTYRTALVPTAISPKSIYCSSIYKVFAVEVVVIYIKFTYTDASG